MDVFFAYIILYVIYVATLFLYWETVSARRERMMTNAMKMREGVETGGIEIKTCAAGRLLMKTPMVTSDGRSYMNVSETTMNKIVHGFRINILLRIPPEFIQGHLESRFGESHITLLLASATGSSTYASDIFKYLVYLGADTTAVDSSGRMALDRAKQFTGLHIEYEKFLNSL